MINPIAPYLILLHQQDLRDEARREEFAHRVELANPTVPAWRRALGAGAQRLSDGFASAARTFDPDIDCVDAAAA
ncbi:MAG TPA: hypothetical protein VJ850_00515 [Candidatus Limnocylindrales bacterium]|nr:hypothetical protein [Candidatus Limnocylindrales bacterium]